MDASEFKEQVFGMLFLKRLSDKYDEDRELKAKEYRAKGLPENIIQQQLESPKHYDFYVPESARWHNIRHIKEHVGTALNKALHAIEDANPDTLQDVLKGINYNKKVGQKSIDDSRLVEFIQHFEHIPLRDEDFEFPDLLGAAYEYLIKYFADSAGKKGGEFYTPAEVVRLLVRILDPQEGMAIADPAAGSGGMLIQSKEYIEERGGNIRNLSLYGQELNGTTWAICRMNMLLHGVYSAKIENDDTLKNPRHIEDNGELKRFDRVIANPPFSQNYKKEGMAYKERFNFFMPESGKKGDMMFVQHMSSSLNTNGKMAVVMPHGVLFRGGEEKACRSWYVKSGQLEAVIGLPAGLFYGTGIPACVLVINKEGAAGRKGVLFINADREYKEGKNQNKLRPEDIEKISYVYANKLQVEGYSRLVSHQELEEEAFNLNIRRYVDNSPAPEPHDVTAHLYGGIPEEEVNSLNRFFQHYEGLKERIFASSTNGKATAKAAYELGNDSAGEEVMQMVAEPEPAYPVALKKGYTAFLPHIRTLSDIKSTIESSAGLERKHSDYQKALKAWWEEILPKFKVLPQTKQVHELRTYALESIYQHLYPLGVLDLFKIRGFVAGFWNEISADLKSVAASGWGAELIADEIILQSQFPEVVEEYEVNIDKIAELEGLFAEAEGEDYDFEESETGILSKQVLKDLKKDYKETKDKRIKTQLDKHDTFAKELKALKKVNNTIDNQRKVRIERARKSISPAEAEQLILERWSAELEETMLRYLGQYKQVVAERVEMIYKKYYQPLEYLLQVRDDEKIKLDQYLKGLGYAK